MAGKIRTKEKCPKCKGSFKGNALRCSTCLTTPRRYFIDLHAIGHGRLKIYSDKTGHPLDSFARAQRALEAIRYEIDQHVFDPTKYSKADISNFLFENRIKAWHQSKESDVEKGNLAASYTVKLKCYKNNYYLPFFTGMDVREIRTYHIHVFYDKLPLKSKNGDKKISLKYIKNILNALENFFNLLHRHDYIKEKPNFPIITVDRKAPKWVDRKTQIEIIKAVPEGHRPLFSFLAFQGVRPGEARALKVKDISFENESVTISRTFSGGQKQVRERVKGKVVRPRALNPTLVPMLTEVCENKHPEAYVFTQKNGRHYSEKALRKLWEAARDSLGLDMTLYEATRHSFASNAVTDSIPINIIKEVMGHTDIKTTMIYAHADLNSQRVLFKKQSEVIDLNARPQTTHRLKS